MVAPSYWCLLAAFSGPAIQEGRHRKRLAEVLGISEAVVRKAFEMRLRWNPLLGFIVKWAQRKDALG